MLTSIQSINSIEPSKPVFIASWETQNYHIVLIVCDRLYTLVQSKETKDSTLLEIKAAFSALPNQDLIKNKDRIQACFNARVIVTVNGDPCQVVCHSRGVGGGAFIQREECP